MFKEGTFETKFGPRWLSGSTVSSFAHVIMCRCLCSAPRNVFRLTAPSEIRVSVEGQRIKFVRAWEKGEGRSKARGTGRAADWPVSRPRMDYPRLVLRRRGDRKLTLRH